jgi:predicted histone-like DNA-binding protein
MVYHLKQVPGASETYTLEDLALNIEKSSSLTVGDVVHSTNALVRELKKVLLQGNRVKIDGFGIFSLTLNATEVETEKECTVKTINKVNIRFRADNELRLINQSRSRTCAENAIQFAVAPTPATAGSTKIRKKTEKHRTPDAIKPQNTPLPPGDRLSPPLYFGEGSRVRQSGVKQQVVMRPKTPKGFSIYRNSRHKRYATLAESNKRVPEYDLPPKFNQKE